MAVSARERLARLLGGATARGSFAARMTAPADALRLEVEGLGPVAFPLRAPRTKKLIEVARPARFGRREETLTDPGVRDTWEISPDRFELGGAAWQPVLDAALEHFRDELGLPVRTRLRAEPHALLVYGKGQFFLPHQDSEKDDAMVGTLVVSLPSAHTGGELVVEHGGERRNYQASKEELTLVAFYADCRHEVKPVKSGYRVTLTFHLIAEAEAGAVTRRRTPARSATSRPASPSTSASRPSRAGEPGRCPRPTAWSICSTTSTPSAGCPGAASRARTPIAPPCCAPPRCGPDARRSLPSPR